MRIFDVFHGEMAVVGIAREPRVLGVIKIIHKGDITQGIDNFRISNAWELFNSFVLAVSYHITHRIEISVACAKVHIYRNLMKSGHAEKLTIHSHESPQRQKD